MKNKEITEYAMSLALKHGCQDVKVVLMQNNEDAIDLRDGKMERIHHALARSLVMNLFIDGRDGFFYIHIIFVSIVMKGNKFTVILINS